MNEGWICPRCGNSNSPQLLVCGCSSGTATTAATELSTAATTAATEMLHSSNGNADKGSKSLGSKGLQPKNNSKNKYSYAQPDFAAFWDVYPLKRGKAAAYRKFVAAVDAGVAAADIIEAAAAYRDDPNRSSEFTKWPEGWLTAGRWDDEMEVAAPPSNVPAVGEADPASYIGTPENLYERFGDLPTHEQLEAMGSERRKAFEAIVNGIGGDE